MMNLKTRERIAGVQAADVSFDSQISQGDYQARLNVEELNLAFKMQNLETARGEPVPAGEASVMLGRV